MSMHILHQDHRNIKERNKTGDCPSDAATVNSNYRGPCSPSLPKPLCIPQCKDSLLLQWAPSVWTFNKLSHVLAQDHDNATKSVSYLAVMHALQGNKCVCPLGELNFSPFCKIYNHLCSNSNSSSEIGPQGVLLNDEEYYKKVLGPIQHQNLYLFLFREGANYIVLFFLKKL
jgi:hypothetical protein